MKVCEVIEKLKNLDPDKELLIALYTSTQAYSVAQFGIPGPDHIGKNFDGATISVWLPEGMYVAKRGGAA